MKYNIKKPDWWKEVPIMNNEQLLEFAQMLYDKDNWQGLTHEEYKKLNVAKSNYKQRTGKDMKLEYNCPP